MRTNEYVTKERMTACVTCNDVKGSARWNTQVCFPAFEVFEGLEILNSMNLEGWTWLSENRSDMTRAELELTSQWFSGALPRAANLPILT